MRFVVGLYPPCWRRRDGEELEILLDETDPSPARTFDLLRGAVAAWIHRRKGAPITEPFRRIPAYLALVAPILFVVTVRLSARHVVTLLLSLGIMAVFAVYLLIDNL